MVGGTNCFNLPLLSFAYHATSGRRPAPSLRGIRVGVCMGGLVTGLGTEFGGAAEPEVAEGLFSWSGAVGETVRGAERGNCIRSEDNHNNPANLRNLLALRDVPYSRIESARPARHFLFRYWDDADAPAG